MLKPKKIAVYGFADRSLQNIHGHRVNRLVIGFRDRVRALGLGLSLGS